MTLESVKHVNNPAEMVKNPLQWGTISHEMGTDPIGSDVTCDIASKLAWCGYNIKLHKEPME